jgi:hypothetical protein
MATQEPSQEQVVQAVYGYAAELMKSGHSEWEIKSKLMGQGIDEESASVIVNNLITLRSQATQKAAKRNMIIGGLVCLVGIVVTVGTYAGASGGGTYIVA